MSLFPRSFQEFSPLFRLLDDCDRASRHHSGSSSSFAGQSLRTFSPKFDVKELKDSYELHGELPGIEQKNVAIEWTDGNTLTISGRAEHRAERGTPPTKGFIEGERKDEAAGSDTAHDYHKPTVEDEGEGAAPAAEDSAVTTTTNATKDVGQKTDNGAKYWVTERSIGEFFRSFSFPSRVNQDAVKASLSNGILSIVVPKAEAPKPRKITIE